MPKRRARSSAKAPAKKARNRSSIYDDPERLLSDETSPIYQDNVNLKNILQHPLAQTALREAGLEIDFSSLNCDDLSSAIAAFKEDGRCGRHDPEWVRQAMEASERRANGEFDEYVKANLKETWGVDWPEEDDCERVAEGEEAPNTDEALVHAQKEPQIAEHARSEGLEMLSHHQVELPDADMQGR